MIRDKQQCRYDIPPVPEDPPIEEPVEEMPFEIIKTPLTRIFDAVCGILKRVQVNPIDPESPYLFKTVKYDAGQMSRITHHKINTEGAVGLPAAFVHFIDINWLVSSARLGEGTAKMRIKFVLNRLNNLDDDYQMEGFRVFHNIKSMIADNMGEISKYALECRLTYFDPVENMDDGVQEYWITYEVRFRDYSDYYYKNYVDRYVVIPPFTNHSDQIEEVKPTDHEDHEREFDEASALKTNFSVS